MNEVLKVAKIDTIAIKPYLSMKNFIIFLAIALFMTISMKRADMFLYMSFFMTLMYQSYPFIVGESSGLERVYRMFGFDNRNVVRGRYLWVITSGLFVIILGLIISLLASFVLEKEGLKLQEYGLTVLVYYWILILIVSFQYPLMFKLEYSKARQFSTIPLFLTFMIIFLVGNFLGLNKVEELALFAIKNIEVVIACFLCILFAILFISIKISEKFYCEKEI